MAPTTERDFCMLPNEKRRVYKEIQAAHIHGSPDGPWFFIIGRSENAGRQHHLIGITDTSMLRPQVFALQDGETKIGLIASERQAIDACLRSLASDDSRFAAKADIYWNAGGSYTDGGAFIFTVDRSSEKPRLSCIDKFGREVSASNNSTPSRTLGEIMNLLPTDLKGTTDQLADEATSIQTLCASLEQQARSSVEDRSIVISTLTWLLDNLHRIPNGRQGRFHETVEFALFKILRNIPQISHPQMGGCVRIDAASRALLRPPRKWRTLPCTRCVGIPAEGSGSASAIIVEAYKNGWKQVLSFDWRGQRFCGSGLGPGSKGFRIDVYGNPGDYLASGLDGAEMYVHAAAQDQVAQIMKSGKLVIYGDVGQTFMYARKVGRVRAR